MKKLLLSLAILFCLTGCFSGKIDTKDKAVLLKGNSYIFNVDTGYNPITKTFTPKLLSIISTGKYMSFPVDENSDIDYLYVEDDETYSIWNSKSVTKNFTFIFISKDKSLMSEILDVLKEKYKEGKKK